MKKLHLILLLGSLALLFLFRQPAAAQSQPSADEINAVAKGLYCPVCESTPLDACPTQACADWRELIGEQLASGMTQQEIHDYFAQQYGDGVLAETPRRGFGLVLWAFPVLAVLVGGYFFSRQLTAMRAPKRTPAAPQTTSLDDYRQQIEQELEQSSS